MSEEEKKQLNCDLINAYERNDRDAVKSIVESYSDRRYAHNMRIFWAIQFDDDEEVESLINDSKTYINWTNEAYYRRSLLYQAAACNKVSMAEMILKLGANINVQDHNHQTPLFFCRSFEATQLLLDKGARVEHKDIHGRTPTHLAAVNNSVDALSTLIRHGSKLDTQDNYGDTPLHDAAGGNHQDMVDILLRHGSNVDTRNNSGQTPTHQAAFNNSVDALSALIRHGSNLDTRNNLGETALDLAKRKGNEECVHILEEAMKNQKVDKHLDKPGQPNDSEQSKTASVSMALKEIDRQHLVKAMKDGFVQSHITKAVIQGAARSGKTSLKSLILSLPYKELSTPCIQAPDIAVGTLSIDRFGKSGKCWTFVNNEDMEEKLLAELHMIALQLKKEPSSTISPMSLVSPRVNEDDQEISQNDIDVSSEFPVTPGQTEDMEKAVALIQELYHRCSKGIKAQELSHHEHWLYFTDCGGQIQFQKLLPAFLPCASALMLVINLAEDLSGPASTEMCLATGLINVSEHSPKVEEMLKQLLVMVNSSSQQQKAIIENDRILSKYIRPPDSLSIMAIATHRDEYDGKSESIEDKEEKLTNILNSAEGKICYQNKAQFKILHEVDGRKAIMGIFDDPVVEQIAFKLREQAYIVKVPLKWHCFQTLIQKVALTSCGVLNLSLCKVFGHKLGMSDEEVVSAIKFFHILNSMLYYPDSGADDVVFANLHCLIDIINELMVTICNARNVNKYPNLDIKLLAMEGIVTLDFIKTMETCSNILKSFPHFVEKLLAIFQHLLIAVKVENNEDQFFIPALLPVCDTTDINPFPESTIPPMLFYFKKGLPMGLFCSIIVHLLSRKWSIIRNRNALNYSNFMIIQPLKRIGKFAIMETPYYIQLLSELVDDIENVRCAIHESVEAAVKGNVKPEPGFFCPCPHEPRNHIAVVAQDQPTLLRCCETNKIVEDVEGRPHLAWYGEIPEAATTQTDDTASKSDHSPQTATERSVDDKPLSGISSFIKSSLKTVAIGIGIIATFLLLYFLVTGVTSVFTKSNGTGGFIPDDVSNILFSHLSDITEVQPFCIYLGLVSECNKQYNSLDEQKIVMLRKWQDLQRRTWRDFIRPFVMLQKCVKAQELAKTYSVYFYDEEELKKCKKINNHNEL